MKKMYITFGFISMLFIASNFASFIPKKISEVLMSIGASLIGAVVLGIFIEKINKKTNQKKRKIILYPSIKISKEILNSLEDIKKDLSNSSIIGINCNNENYQELLMKKYFYLSEKDLLDGTNISNDFVNEIDSIINDSLLESMCKICQEQYENIINTKNILIANNFINDDEISDYEIANSRIDYFLKKSEKCILLTNALNFEEYVKKISQIDILKYNSKKIKRKDKNNEKR